MENIDDSEFIHFMVFKIWLLDLLAPNTLPELPTRVEMEIQKSQQDRRDAQPTVTEELKNKSDEDSMMEPIQSEIAESEIVDIDFEFE